MNKELDALTDKLLEVTMKLRATEAELEAIRVSHEKELSKFAHNLKNPVGVISSFAEMLQGNTSMDEEKRSKYLDIIQSSSKFSIALINSFQEYHKIKNGYIIVKPQKVDFDIFIQELISEVRPQLIKRNQTIELISNYKLSPKLVLDKEQFQLVFNAIVNNASRYSSENSLIRIEIEESDDTITTTIVDSGIGVEDKDQPKLTDAFFTVNTYDTYQEKCIGLGLTKTEIILSQMGGELTISSEIGKGTQVRILMKKE